MTPKEKLSIAALCVPLFGAAWAGITFAVDYEQSLVKQNQMQQYANGIIRDSLEDKVEELNATKNRTEIQELMLLRYQRKLDKLDKQEEINKGGAR